MLSSDLASNAWMPPNRKPKQPKDPNPGSMSRHAVSIHGAPWTNAAMAVTMENKPASTSAL